MYQDLRTFMIVCRWTLLSMRNGFRHKVQW